jgi:hypothetical protein
MENMEPEEEDPRITIAVLRDLLAEKTAEVENLKERIAEIEQIAVLAKTFSFDVQVKKQKKHLCICAQLSQNCFKYLNCCTILIQIQCRHCWEILGKRRKRLLEQLK